MTPDNYRCISSLVVEILPRSNRTNRYVRGYPAENKVFALQVCPVRTTGLTISCI